MLIFGHKYVIISVTKGFMGFLKSKQRKEQGTMNLIVPFFMKKI